MRRYLKPKKPLPSQASPNAVAARSKPPTPFQNFAMSKPVGRVLDSKVGKAGVAVGNAVIKGAKSLMPDWKKVGDDLFGSPEIDKKQREAGKVSNRSYSGLPSNVKIKK